MPFCPKCSNSLLNIEPIPIPPILNGKAADPTLDNRQPLNLSGPILAPLPVMPPYTSDLVNKPFYPLPRLPTQLDGCMTLPDSLTDTSHELSQQQQSPSFDLSSSPNLLPNLHSTPVQPSTDNPPLAFSSSSLSILPSGDISASISLQSLPDLENYLPHRSFEQAANILPTEAGEHATPSDLSSEASGLSAYTIPVIVGVRNPYPTQHQRQHPPQVKTIRRDNRAVTALSLPRIMITNHRSIFPKFNHFVDEVLEMNMQLGLHSEVWEDVTNSNHANKIEEALELHGIQYISTPRVQRRGGGAAITLIKDSPFFLTKLFPTYKSDEECLEICWGLLKLKQPTSEIKYLIVCSFYLPPRSRKKSALINHINVNYFIFKSNYPDSAFVLGGDKNDLNLQHLLDIDPSLRQLVTQPTHRQSVLCVLITDLGPLYEVPIVRPALQPDNPHTACPSDHKIALAIPHSDASNPVSRKTFSRVVRPITEDNITAFASWIQHEPWTFVYDGVDSSDMVDRFNFLIDLYLKQCCPEKRVKASNLDGKLRSIAVAQACRRKKREYTKNGNSVKYKALKKEAKAILKSETSNFLAKQISRTGSKTNSWLRHVKTLAACPGEGPSPTFSLPSHIEENLTALESSDRICDFFSSISQEYHPLNVETLPNNVRSKLASDPCYHPPLPDHVVFEVLKKGKKTCSVNGDIPIKILEEFLPELTPPVAAIFREAISTHCWPKSYKKEFHIPINKVPSPQSEDDLRNLGLTPYFSKRLEWLLIQWIWPFISPHIDVDQLGGLPGCSVNHYLIQMIDFIHRKLDTGGKDQAAVIACLVDFSKAFNRMDHNILITILSDLNIPTCALRLIISYLSNRKMCVRYQGETSAEKDIPGGGPQGGLLTVILFDLQVNLAGFPCPIRTLLLPTHHGPEPDPLQAGPLPPCHQPNITLKKKYVDDLSMLEVVKLGTQLIPAPPFHGPPNFHEQARLVLPPENSVLQHQLSDLLSFTNKNKMKINMKKTKILPFNMSSKFDFLPQLSFPNEEPLEVIYQTRLLGVTLSSDLTWSAHTKDITSRASRKLWILVRFKALGGNQEQLLSVYQLRIRSTLEFAAPVFHSGLTKDQSRSIEMIQKKSFAIILGQSYQNYESALTTLNQERLSTRRIKLCLNFAIKCSKSPRHCSMFPHNDNLRENMRFAKKFKESSCRTSRHYNSSLPFMRRLLNKET